MVTFKKTNVRKLKCIKENCPASSPNSLFLGQQPTKDIFSDRTYQSLCCKNKVNIFHFGLTSTELNQQ